MSIKLYLWNDVLTDYSSGMAMALGSSKEDAINKLVNEYNKMYSETNGGKKISKNISSFACVVHTPKEFASELKRKRPKIIKITDENFCFFQGGCG